MNLILGAPKASDSAAVDEPAIEPQKGAFV